LPAATRDLAKAKTTILVRNMQCDCTFPATIEILGRGDGSLANGEETRGRGGR